MLGGSNIQKCLTEPAPTGALEIQMMKRIVNRIKIMDISFDYQKEVEGSLQKRH